MVGERATEEEEEDGKRFAQGEEDSSLAADERVHSVEGGEEEGERDREAQVR